MNRIGPRRCWCCGVEESRGCVIGFPCRCETGNFLDHCHRCYKCLEHCQCTPRELLTKADKLAESGAHEWAGTLRERALEKSKHEIRRGIPA